MTVHRLTWGVDRDNNTTPATRGSVVGSGHHLLVFRIKLKSRRASAQSENQRKVHYTAFLNDNTKQNEFRITLNNRFQSLEKLIEDEAV